MGNTPQQTAVIDCPADPGSTVVIGARAGTGKTYTLIEKAKEIMRTNVYARILYLAYNRAIADEAGGKFPANTVTSTCHSLAYRAFGFKLKHKLRTSIRKTTIKDVCMEYLKNNNNRWVSERSGSLDFLERLDEKNGVIDLSIDPTKNYRKKEVAVAALQAKDRCWSKSDRQFRWKLAFLVKDTLDNYLYGGSDAVGTCHVDSELAPYIMDAPGFAELVAELATHLHGRMSDPEELEIPALHDTYLKEYARSHPDLAKSYEVILIDESQDLNGAIHSMLEHTDKACKIYVGDEHQQIYAWRGSVNAMDRIEADHRFNLTKSFRFGAYLAELASKVLHTWKDDREPIVGNDDVTTLIDTYDGYSGLPKGTTVLARTNAYLLKVADDLTKSQKPFSFVGGFPSEQVQLIKDVEAIKNGKRERIQTDYLQVFDNYVDLQMYADHAKDNNVQAACGLVERYGTTLTPMLIAVEDWHRTNEGMHVDYLLCTGHKSKGCEWQVVAMAEDFRNIFYNGIRALYESRGRVADLEDAAKNNKPLPETLENTEEGNLLYVAITRAQCRLLLTENTMKFLGSHFAAKGA